MLARQKADSWEKEKSDAKAARKAGPKRKEVADAKIKKESHLKGADYKAQKEVDLEGADARLKDEIKSEGADSYIKNEINSDNDHKAKTPTTTSRAEKAKLKAEKLQEQLRKVEKRAARAAAKADKLRAEACQHEEVNQIEMPAKVSTTVEGHESVETVKIPTPNQGSEVAFDIAFLKEENLEQFRPRNIEIELSGVGHTEVGDDALDSQEKVPDPLTPTSQPYIQGSLELAQEHETATNRKALPEQGSDTFNPHKEDLDSIINSANPPKTDQIAVESNSLLPTSSSSSSPILSEIDSDDETIGSDGSTSSASSSAAPDSQPTKRIKPDRVPPPKRGKKNGICRNFLHSGRCKKGDSCAFRHELPYRMKNGGRRNGRMKPPIQEESKRRGMGLFQRVRYWVPCPSHRIS